MMSFSSVTRGREINMLLHYPPKHAGSSIFFLKWGRWKRLTVFRKRNVNPKNSANTTHHLWICLDGLLGKSWLIGTLIHFIFFRLQHGPSLKQLPMESFCKRSSQYLLLNKIIAVVIWGVCSIFTMLWEYPKWQHWEAFEPRMIDNVCKYLLCKGFSSSIDGNDV